MKNVRNLSDLIPKSGVQAVRELPKGKPLYRSVCTNGGFRQITYIFKQGVFIRNTFKGFEQLFIKRPEIVASTGDFLK